MMTAEQPPPSDSDLWRALKALGSPVRLEVIRFIQAHPHCISNQIQLHLPPGCACAQSTLSQHLKILRDAQLVVAESDGAATSYTLNAERMAWLSEQLKGYALCPANAAGVRAGRP